MKILPKNGILIAFGELFLKSEGVKKLFQRKLIYDLKFFLKRTGVNFKIHQFHERLFIETPENCAETIKKISGISWFAECLYFPKTDLKGFGNFIDKNYKSWIKKGESFAIRLRTGGEIISSLGGPALGGKQSKEKIIERIARNINRKVNLDNPKKELLVEIRKNGLFLYFKKEQGFGGLPSGASGKVLTLISGGIDSPVAAYLIAKRGAENVWIHFHSFPLVSNKSIEKIKELTEIFLNYQRHLRVYYLPFSKIQLEIKAKAPEQYRILLYRRLMLKIAEIIAKKENCKALVTGESLGQVSSQTLSNLNVTEEAVKIPVLRPLVAMDKEEIMELARKMGTYQISIKPQEDCCTLFTPKHPTAEGKLEIAKELEKRLNIPEIIKDIIKEAKVMVR